MAPRTINLMPTVVISSIRGGPVGMQTHCNGLGCGSRGNNANMRQVADGPIAIPFGRFWTSRDGLQVAIRSPGASRSCQIAMSQYMDSTPATMVSMISTDGPAGLRMAHCPKVSLPRRGRGHSAAGPLGRPFTTFTLSRGVGSPDELQNFSASYPRGTAPMSDLR